MAQLCLASWFACPLSSKSCSFFLYLKYSTKGLCTVSLYVDSLSHIFASLFELRQSNTYAKKQLFSFPNLMLMPLPPLFFSKMIQYDFS